MAMRPHDPTSVKSGGPAFPLPLLFVFPIGITVGCPCKFFFSSIAIRYASMQSIYCKCGMEIKKSGHN
jgi:hypothetical protein